MESFERKIDSALSLEHEYEDRAFDFLKGELRAAAVLVLFGYSEKDTAFEPYLLLTRRTESVETHKGQIAFPGGVSDPEDFEDQGATTTALRETEEEVGIPRSEIRVLGRLPRLPTVTGFDVTPFVGTLKRPVEQVALKPSEGEIAEVFWVPMSVLMHSDTYRREVLTVGGAGGAEYPIHVYQVKEHRIWGVTAAIIKNLLDRLGGAAAAPKLIITRPPSHQ